MTTDVNGEPEKQTSNENLKEDKKTTESNPTEDLLKKLNQMFDDKIKALTDSFEEKIKTQEDKLKEKDDQIEKLKQSNANMALTSNFGKENAGVVDYESKDFDDVDWTPQAKSFMDNIDAKIFDLKAKSN